MPQCFGCNLPITFRKFSGEGKLLKSNPDGTAHRCDRGGAARPPRRRRITDEDRERWQAQDRWAAHGTMQMRGMSNQDKGVYADWFKVFSVWRHVTRSERLSDAQMVRFREHQATPMLIALWKKYGSEWLEARALRAIHGIPERTLRLDEWLARCSEEIALKMAPR